jgi:hypothetical protein
MAKLNTQKASATARVMLFGAPKTGKTQLAGELAEFFNVTLVDLENGHDTLFKLPEEWQERIELIAIPDTRDYPMGIETCLKIVKGPVEICEQHGKVSCMVCRKEELPTSSLDVNSFTKDDVIIFDSSTQLTNSCIANVTKGKSDDYKLDWDDWRKVGVLMDTFFGKIQQGKYNVVVISHETEVETTDKQKKILVPVGGTGNFSRNVAKYFDHIVYAERKNRTHAFSSGTTTNSNVLTGSRRDIELESSAKPSLLQIFKPELYAEKDVIHTPASSGSKASLILNRLKENK